MQHKLKICCVFFLSLLLLFSCDKKDKKKSKQYSTWIVNGTDTFTTSNVDSQIACNPDKSYCSATLMCEDAINWFNIGFYLDYMPSSGNIPLADFLQIPSNKSNYIFIYFYYQNKGGYIPMHPELDTMYIYSNGNKISYNLDAMWFVNNNDLTDSILIQGIFNIP